MSPRIEIEVHSTGKDQGDYRSESVPNIKTAFDQKNLKLYVQMSQIFSIWIVPFHVAPVTLTTVLDLTTEPNRGESRSNGDHTLYYITQQEDLYQTSEFVKFVFPHVGHWLILAWHLVATIFCVLGVFFLWPMLWLEENDYLPNWITKGNVAYNMDKKIGDIKEN